MGILVRVDHAAVGECASIGVRGVLQSFDTGLVLFPNVCHFYWFLLSFLESHSRIVTRALAFPVFKGPVLEREACLKERGYERLSKCVKWSHYQ